MIKVEQMTVAVPVELASTVKRAIESGDYTSLSEVFSDALRDWNEKRQMQQQEVQAIQAGVRRGLDDLKAGRLKPAPEVFTNLERKYQAV